MNRRATSALIGATLLFTAACGTTVPMGQQVTYDQNGNPVVAGELGSGDGLGGDMDGVSGAGGGTGGAGGSGGSLGGSSGTASGSGGSSGTTGPGPAAAPSASGGPISKGDPVEIGFVTTGVSNAEGLGFASGASYSDKQMYAALVAEYNKTGGLAGHPIKPVYAATDTGGSDWANQFAAACSTFTEDNSVQAVVGYLFAFFDSFESCLARAGVVHFFGGYQPGDEEAQRQYPTLIATGHPTVDGANLTVLSGARQAGLIGGDKKVGLLLDTCANGDRAYARSTKPWLDAQDIEYQTVFLDCPGGAGDAGSAAAVVSNAQLQFATNGVDVVYSSGVALVVFMTQAESQGYRPGYITSIAGQAVVDNAPAAQTRNLHGFGWMPVVDVPQSRQPAPVNAAQKACLAKLAAQGLQPKAYNDFMTAYETCDGLELYAKALAKTGSASATTIAAAASSLMGSTQSAGTYGGALRAGEGQRGGPAMARQSSYNSSCACMTYVGSPFSVPLP